MKFVGVVGAALLLACVSSASFAFQEQGAPAPDAAPAAAGSAPAAQGEAAKAAPQAEFAADKADPAKGGTEVRIPGLGRLGVLPKMDFGLELLYGANEGKQPQIEDPQQPNSDVTIRGSIKHNF